MASDCRRHCDVRLGDWVGMLEWRSLELLPFRGASAVLGSLDFCILMDTLGSC